MSKSSTELLELIEFNRNSDWPDLSSQQQLFAISYLEDYDLSHAASKAAVSPTVARGFLREPLVLAFINDLQAHLDNRSVITKDFVHLQWLKLLPKLMGEEAVAMVDKSGAEFMARKFHAAESVSLVKELGKATGIYDDHKSGDEDAPPLNISFNVSKPVADVKVTRGK